MIAHKQRSKTNITTSMWRLKIMKQLISFNGVVSQSGSFDYIFNVSVNYFTTFLS